VSGRVGNGIGALDITAGGTGYVDGTYADVDLIGGSGSSATATVEVRGGKVVSVELHSGGAGYRVGDSIRIARSSLGDLSGKAEGFAGRVTALTALEKLTVAGAHDVIFDEPVVIDGDLVIQASGSVQFLDQVLITGGGRLIIEGAAELLINNGMRFEGGGGKSAGGLQFEGVVSGATASFPAGLATGDANRVVMSGIRSLDLVSSPAPSAFDLTLEGGAVSFAAPIGQPQMVLSVGEARLEVGAFSLPSGVNSQFIAGSLRLHTSDDLGSEQAPLKIASAKVDIESSQGNLFVLTDADVQVSEFKSAPDRTASLGSINGSITLERNAVVSGETIQLVALKGALSGDESSLVTGDSLTIRVAQGVGSQTSPLATAVGTIEVVSEGGDVLINELDGVALAGEGITIRSGSGELDLVSGGDITMSPTSRVQTTDASVELRARGDVALSQVYSERGSIRIESGGAIYDNTRGSGSTHLRTASTLMLKAVSGIGGYASAELRVDADTVALYNQTSGDVVITGERGIRAGSAGIVSDASDGMLAVFSVTGRVDPGSIKAASGKLVMLSGRSGLTEEEVAGLFVAMNMANAMSTPGSSQASSDSFGSVGMGRAPFGAGALSSSASGLGGASALSSLPPSLSSAPGQLAAAGVTAAGSSTATGSRGSDLVVAGRPVGAGESATSAVASAAVSASGSAPLPEGQGLATISTVASSMSTIGSVTTLGRSTSLMLDAALKAVETSSRPLVSGSGTLSELMNRTPLMRTDSSLRLREGDGSSATTPAVTAPASPAVPAGSAPASGAAPATATGTAPGAPAPAVPSGTAVPPPSDSGATGTPSGATPVPGSPLPSGPAGAAEGAPGAGGRDADGRSGSSPQAPAGTGQGDAPSDEPRSSLPGLFEVSAAGSSLWARVARWLNPDSPRTQPPSAAASDSAATPVPDTSAQSAPPDPALSYGTDGMTDSANVAQSGAAEGGRAQVVNRKLGV
jgi:hypothetical protein